MAEEESPASAEVEHSYLDVGPTGPRRGLLMMGALVLILTVFAAFYGLYTLNRGASPTLTPDPAALTQAALSVVGVPGTESANGTPTFAAETPTPPETVTITPAAKPPTYTVQIGDTLIGIAQRLNVNVNDLTALNQLGGETIFPNQVLLVPPTVTPWPETGPFRHTVSRGETLLSIAALYRVTVDEIKTLNGLTSDTIFVGQQVLIPTSGVRPPTPAPMPELWVPAVITGELDIAYPFTTIKDHFTLHIAPGAHTTASNELEDIARLVETALDHSQEVLQRPFAGRFDVYVSKSLFDAPFTTQLSFSEPPASRLFLLYDGTTTPEEELYFVTYALIQMMAVHTLGKPASPLLNEGLAVYAAGQTLLKGGDYLSLNQFCAALQRAGALPRLTQPLELEGQLGYLDQYLAAGCFVGHLMETEGTAAFTQVYLNGDYSAVYERSLDRLVFEWGASLHSAVDEALVDPDELAEVMTDINDAYRRLWADFEGTSVQMAAYQWLDRARSALLQGHLDTAQQHLNEFEELLK